MKKDMFACTLLLICSIAHGADQKEQEIREYLSKQKEKQMSDELAQKIQKIAESRSKGNEGNIVTNNPDRFRVQNEELMHDNAYSLGDLDILVLKKAALEKGFEVLKQELTTHVFDEGRILETIPPVYVSRPKPYIIEQNCTKDDQSTLAKEAFDRIADPRCECFHGNRLNEKRENDSDVKCFQRLDYCTYATIPENSYFSTAKTVRICTEFYNKKSTLDALNRLQQ